MPKPLLTKAFLQPAKAAAMCTAPRAETHPHSPIHIPPLLLVQNLSSKRIAPIDNMRPKLHDEYTCHSRRRSVTLALAPQRLSKASGRSATPVRAPQGVGCWILE